MNRYRVSKKWYTPIVWDAFPGSQADCGLKLDERFCEIPRYSCDTLLRLSDYVHYACAGRVHGQRNVMDHDKCAFFTLMSDGASVLTLGQVFFG